MIRGIGDPLLAMYARAYFVRKSWDIDTALKVCSIKYAVKVSILYARAGTLPLFLFFLTTLNNTPGSHRAVLERQRGHSTSAFTALLAGKLQYFTTIYFTTSYYYILYYRLRQLSQPYWQVNINTLLLHTLLQVTTTYFTKGCVSSHSPTGRYANDGTLLLHILLKAASAFTAALT